MSHGKLHGKDLAYLAEVIEILMGSRKDSGMRHGKLQCNLNWVVKWNF